MTDAGFLWLCALGMALGVRHALEPDHVAAVANLLTRREPHRHLRLGALWGLGHAAGLWALGLVLHLLVDQVPSVMGEALESMVAVMLMGLGFQSVRRASQLGQMGMWSAHTHGSKAHGHTAPTRHLHLAGRTLATGPFVVGVFHGMAGSGALVALSASHAGGAWQQLAYMVCFGVGSLVGMSWLTGMAGALLGRCASVPGMLRVSSTICGVLSVVIGGRMLVEIWNP